jgi:hypothetical protein
MTLGGKSEGGTTSFHTATGGGGGNNKSRVTIKMGRVGGNQSKLTISAVESPNTS